MRIVLVGVGLFPHIVAGDKNFFTRLIPFLAGNCETIDVISINDRSGTQSDPVGNCRVTYHNVKRVLHVGDPGRFFSGQGTLLDYRHKHKPPQEVAEILMTTISRLPAFKRIVRDGNVEVIHFMDNMGPSMRLIKRLFGEVLVTHSAMTYSPRGRMYDRYIRYSLEKLDRLLPYSRAYADRLIELGIAPEKIEVIRWGVELTSSELDPSRKRQLRETYGVPPTARLFLWSGFIQQIGEQDFLGAVETAKQVRKLRPESWFLFAFKPRSFRREFKNLESEGIKVVTNVECFRDLLETADFFLSPLLGLKSTVAPPLTWLEAMSVGTPVVTTGARGVDEVVFSGENGFVAASFENLVDVAIEAVDHDGLAEMGRNCRDFIARESDIRSVAARYLRVWSEARSV